MKKILPFLMMIIITIISVASFADSSFDLDFSTLDDETLVNTLASINSVLQSRNTEYGIQISKGTYIAGFDFPAGGYDIMVPDDADYNSVQIDAYTAACLKMIAETGAYPYPDLVMGKYSNKDNPYHVYLQKGDKLIVDNSVVMVLTNPLFGVSASSADEVLTAGWANASTEVLQSALLLVNSEIQSRLHLEPASKDALVPDTVVSGNNTLPDYNVPVEWENYLSLKVPEGAEVYESDRTALVVFLHGTYGPAFQALYIEDNEYYTDIYICDSVVELVKDAYIDSEATDIVQSDPIIRSNQTYAGVENCYYFETDISYSLNNSKDSMKLVIILVRQNNSVFPFTLICRSEGDENKLMGIMDTIQWISD